MANRAELQRRLASEFAAQGWPYEHDLAPALLDSVERGGATDGQELVRRVPANYLDRNGITRDQMARVLNRALGGQKIEPVSAGSTSVVINDSRNSINISGSQVSGGAFNTGSQISIQGASPREDVLDALATLVTAGLGGEWNTDEVDALDGVIAKREDISDGDVQQRTVDAANKSGAGHAQIKALLAQIGTSTAVGVLTPAITEGLNHLL